MPPSRARLRPGTSWKATPTGNKICLLTEIFSSFQNIFSLKNQIGDKEKLGGKLSEDEESKIEEVINEKIKWLEDNPVSCSR